MLYRAIGLVLDSIHRLVNRGTWSSRLEVGRKVEELAL
jgi:hypothetical protein